MVDLILRDMLVGSDRFNNLARGLPGLSRNLLASRLRHLTAAGLVSMSDGRYMLTDAGLDLRPVVFAMAEWGARWAFPDPKPEELDPDLLVWWMHGQMDQALAPGTRAVVEIHFLDCNARYWLVIEPADVSVCVTDPGFEVDVLLQSTRRALYLVWMARMDFAAARTTGAIELSGKSDLVRAFPTWLRMSPVSPAVRAASRR